LSSPASPDPSELAFSQSGLFANRGIEHKLVKIKKNKKEEHEQQQQQQQT